MLDCPALVEPGSVRPDRAGKVIAKGAALVESGREEVRPEGPRGGLRFIVLGRRSGTGRGSHHLKEAET
jgi:hypothetical protein